MLRGVNHMVAGALESTPEEEAADGSRLSRWLALAAARQQGRGFLWWPIALTLGIWIYFALADEPSLLLAATIAGAAAVLMWLGRSTPIVILAALVAAGFSLAKFRTELTATQLLRAGTAEVVVTGRVAAVVRASRGRLTIILSPDAIEGIAAEKLPRHLRLSSPLKNGAPLSGTRVSLKARLMPLPSPVQPGGFDYGRQLWFASIGGTGRVTATITAIDADVPWRARFEAALADIRAAIGRRIHAVLDEPYASFGEALITGERSTIPNALNQSLLASGLFHILSISGLHMWLVAGGVFWGVRAALALVPPLALRWPIKKWAAVLALAMGLFYMLLANGGVATQRSFLMIAVVFFAVLVDRPALSTRNLAIAALFILVLEPEAAVEASFQMSFLAVLGLVAFYEAWAAYTRGRDGDLAARRHWLSKLALKLTLAAVVSVVTTLIAGGMSSIPAVYHFGRLSPYSVIANGLALPVIGLIVMPFALISALLMPFGLEALPLTIMGEGLKLVLWISDWVASFPGANMVAPQPAILSVMLLATGAVLVCLLLGPWRWSGLALIGIAMGLMLAPQQQPDIFIERSGQNVAIRDAQGLLVPAYPRRARFTVEKWLQANGEEAKLAEAAKRPGWTCTTSRCEAELKGKRIAYLSKAEGQPLDCAGIAILITDFPLRGMCGMVPTRIDRFDLWRRGAHVLTITAEKVVIDTAAGSQGNRPWSLRPERRSTPYKPTLPTK